MKNFSEMWFNINNRGDSNNTHMHANCWLSGCYYLQTPKENTGKICFTDPVSVREHNYDFTHESQQTVHCMDPQVGDLILFPAWLKHGVSANTSDEDRITISFNIVK